MGILRLSPVLRVYSKECARGYLALCREDTVRSCGEAGEIEFSFRGDRDAASDGVTGGPELLLSP